MSLEDAFWAELKKIAAIRNVRTAELIATINRGRKHSNLSSAIRVFVLHHYREQANEICTTPFIVRLGGRVGRVSVLRTTDECWNGPAIQSELFDIQQCSKAGPTKLGKGKD